MEDKQISAPDPEFSNTRQAPINDVPGKQILSDVFCMCNLPLLLIGAAVLAYFLFFRKK